ncbi:two pore domain potassium channel family protein [Lysobacter sp. TY2-98]|uniref:potassium channel family protein n=1 Tax=Lysobacter sp. TY2-98 TaxID=2290922 RepID=UPI000E201BF7|nr:potassium channel family protein [Lysobacter sp. TY2-98]AXK72401.1 two pore domain potassium channel family protein [Lysobacter sp. TY2-98]
MLGNIVIGLLTMAVCLLLQSMLVVAALRYYMSHVPKGGVHGIGWAQLRRVNGVMTLLVLGNIAQVIIWALVFRMLGEFDVIETAVYHSGVNFATLGYGDIVMSEHRRLLGPIEAINGALMIGVSTAVLMTVLQDLFKRRGIGE